MVDFGKDVSCLRVLRTGRLVTGVQLVAEACYRRLTTPRGMLRGGEDEANYGEDLSQLVGSTDAKTAAATLPAKISAELSKDQRVLSVAVDVLTIVDGAETSFEITINVGTAGGPFELQIAVSAVSVELLGITA